MSEVEELQGPYEGEIEVTEQAVRVADWGPTDTVLSFALGSYMTVTTRRQAVAGQPLPPTECNLRGVAQVSGRGRTGEAGVAAFNLQSQLCLSLLQIREPVLAWATPLGQAPIWCTVEASLRDFGPLPPSVGVSVISWGPGGGRRPNVWFNWLVHVPGILRTDEDVE